MATHPTDVIERSVRAFETELRAQLALYGPLDDDPEALGRRAARAATAGLAWAADVGPFYDTAGAQVALDGVSKQAVSQRVTAGRLLGLRLAPDGSGRERLVYPVWQFLPSVLRHLPQLLAAAGYDPDRPVTGWTIAAWLTTADPALAGSTPLELLRADHLEPLLIIAADVAASLGTDERASLRASLSASA
jgi:hypothetical protein